MCLIHISCMYVSRMFYYNVCGMYSVGMFHVCFWIQLCDVQLHCALKQLELAVTSSSKRAGYYYMCVKQSCLLTAISCRTRGTHWDASCGAVMFYLVVLSAALFPRSCLIMKATRGKLKHLLYKRQMNAKSECLKRELKFVLFNNTTEAH